MQQTMPSQAKKKESVANDMHDPFFDLSHKVLELTARVRDCLFSLDVKLAIRLLAECSQLSHETRRAEADNNAALLIGITNADDRYELVLSAQRCSRLGRIVHQHSTIAQAVNDLQGQITQEEIAAFKPIFLMAEVELKDAILSIMRDDEKLAFGVQKKDEELDTLYMAEMERIFHNTSSAMFYNFQTGTNLLFILRAIERIGDHAKQLAVPSFYLLAPRK